MSRKREFFSKAAHFNHALSHKPGNFAAQDRQQVAFEPGVLFEPGIVPPGRVRQRQHFRRADFNGRFEIGLPVCHGLRQRLPSSRPKVICLRILSDDEDQFDLGHFRKQLVVPEVPALLAWRQISALCIQARKAEPHRYDGKAVRIVENLLTNSHPVSEPVSGRISERLPALVDPGPGRLTANAKPCRTRNLQHWSSRVRKRRSNRCFNALLAIANVLHECVEFFRILYARQRVAP